MKIGFIGCGNMARAIIGGIIKMQVAKPEDIFVSAHTEASVKKAEADFSVNGCGSNTEVVKNSDIVFYAVKPQVYEEVISETAGDLTKEKVAVSIAPGKTLKWLGERMGSDIKIVRAMPNTPAQVGEGATAVCVNDAVTDSDLESVNRIFESIGRVYMLKESMMDGFISVCGSSPAYIYMLIDAMADGAVIGGIPKSQAIQLAAQAVLGSAKMVLETGIHPAELRDKVCSPAGTTIEAVRVLEEMGFRSAVIEAEVECQKKSASM